MRADLLYNDPQPTRVYLSAEKQDLNIWEFCVIKAAEDTENTYDFAEEIMTIALEERRKAMESYMKVEAAREIRNRRFQ